MKNRNPEINLKFLQQLAKDLFFELDDEQCQNLLLEFDVIEEKMTVVKEIDTTNVLPLDFLFNIKRNYLRSDTFESGLSVKDVLAVAGEVKDDYIMINKVINDEKN